MMKAFATRTGEHPDSLAPLTAFSFIRVSSNPDPFSSIILGSSFTSEYEGGGEGHMSGGNSVIGQKSGMTSATNTLPANRVTPLLSITGTISFSVQSDSSLTIPVPPRPAQFGKHPKKMTFLVSARAMATPVTMARRSRLDPIKRCTKLCNDVL